MRMFCIDPGSRSSGWAYFVDGELKSHGTITAKGSEIWKRLGEIRAGYLKVIVAGSIDVLVVERMNLRVHRYCAWAATVATQAVYQAAKTPIPTVVEISPPTWKKYLRDMGVELSAIQNANGCQSEDEAVAITLGDTHLNSARKA